MGAKERLPFWREREQEKHGGERMWPRLPVCVGNVCSHPKRRSPEQDLGGPCTSELDGRFTVYWIMVRAV